MTFEEDLKCYMRDIPCSACEYCNKCNCFIFVNQHKNCLDKSKVREVILSNTYQIENRDKILKELGLTSEDKE